MKKTLKYSVFLILIAFISFLFISPNKVVAASTDQYLGQVQLGGDTIGIQIKTKVEIVGKYEIVINDEKIKPWENSDIQEGDYIYSVNDVLINSNNDLNNIILSPHAAMRVENGHERYVMDVTQNVIGLLTKGEVYNVISYKKGY